MKILFICHGAGNGGAERIITTLANEFSKKGNEIVLLTTKKENNTYPLEKSINHVIIEVIGGNVITRTCKRILYIRKEIREFCPKCIISFSAIPNMQVIVANIGLKIPLIISERTDPSKYPESYIGRTLRDILYKQADTIVFQTNEAKNYFRKSIRRKGTIIINPVRDNLPQRYLGVRDNRIVGIGALVPQKNWFIALEAFKSFVQHRPEYIFEIYGEGSQRAEIEKYISSDEILRNKVLLKGFDQRAVERINNAAMYVSSSDYEGISNSMLEALATGVPSICTDCPVGGAKMVIEDGVNGFLVPVGDAKAMSNRMIAIAGDNELSDKLSENATSIRYKYSLNRIVAAWSKEVDKLCNR